MGRACSAYREAYTRFWFEYLNERDHLSDPGLDGRIILRWIFRKWDVEMWTGSSWLRTGRGGGALVTATMNIRIP